MALPRAYLTSVSNLEGILNALQTAQAPRKFTQRFLEGLDFKSSSDRLIINVLKSLGFLSSDGTPTQRYYEYLDQTQSGRVLADGIREAYADLFELNRNAHVMTRAELKNKMKTLTRGEFSESVLDKMAMTFAALSRLADFEAEAGPVPTAQEDKDDDEQARESMDGGGATQDRAEPPSPRRDDRPPQPPLGEPLRLGGLVYNIQIQLPESRDQAVYDALFRSMRSHLFG